MTAWRNCLRETANETQSRRNRTWKFLSLHLEMLHSLLLLVLFYLLWVIFLMLFRIRLKCKEANKNNTGHIFLSEWVRHRIETPSLYDSMCTEQYCPRVICAFDASLNNHVGKRRVRSLWNHISSLLNVSLIGIIILVRISLLDLGKDPISW